MLSSLCITFIGHACLRLDYQDYSLLTDPYSPAIGYAPVEQAVDVAALSHENPKYHSCLNDVRARQVIRGLEHLNESVEKGPFQMRFVEVWEKAPDGTPDRSNPNAMMVLEVAGLRVLHMGDCGHLPTPAQTKQCGAIDVLLALAGGGPTIDLPDLLAFARAVEAKIIIPMHYGLPGVVGNFAPLAELEALWTGEIVRSGTRCQISRADVPTNPQLWVLEPLRFRG